MSNLERDGYYGMGFIVGCLSTLSVCIGAFGEAAEAEVTRLKAELAAKGGE